MGGGRTNKRRQSGSFQEDMIPTVGFNMKKVTKGNVTIKMWDIGGQTRFRSMWERYCRGVNAIVYVVDSADKEKFELSKKELHELLAKPPLAGIPLLVLGNKNDLPEAVTVEELIDTLFVPPPTPLAAAAHPGTRRSPSLTVSFFSPFLSFPSTTTAAD